jgi:serpin B
MAAMKVSRAVSALGLDLYARHRAGEGNLLLSPYGVWLTLAMLHPGARGKTLAQLSAVLGIKDVGAVAELRRELARRAEPRWWKEERGASDVDETLPGTFGFHLEEAGKLWVHTGYPIVPAYRSRLAEVFGADPSPLDLAGDPVAACNAINRWVDQQTHSRISEIVSPVSLASLPRGLLVNAISFKAAWANEFEPGETRQSRFHLRGGESVSRP